MMIVIAGVKGNIIGYDDIFYENDDEKVAKMRDWSEEAKRLLKAELKRKGISYRELAEKLTDDGTPENERNIANKISRGGFTAAFLLQCLSVIGADSVRLENAN